MHRSAAVVLLFLSFSFVISAQSRSDNWLSGTWEGTAYQISDDSVWPMRLSISAKKYIVDYPSLKCGGEWRLVSMNLEEASFVERMTYGKDKCEDDGNIVIERLNDNQVAFRYSSANSTEVTASAILRRK